MTAIRSQFSIKGFLGLDSDYSGDGDIVSKQASKVGR